MNFQKTHNYFVKLIVPKYQDNDIKNKGIICTNCFRSYMSLRDIKDHQKKCHTLPRYLFTNL